MIIEKGGNELFEFAQDMEAECSAERSEGLNASDLNNESSAQVRGDEEYYDEYGYDEYGSYSSRGKCIFSY